MTENYKNNRKNYEENSLEKIIKIFKNTNNNKFIEFLKTGDGLNSYTFEKEKIELQNLRTIHKLKQNEFNNDNRLLQQSLRNKDNDRIGDLRIKVKQERLFLNNIEKNIKIKERDFENKSIYKKLAKKFSILNQKTEENNTKNLKILSKRIEEKNNNLTERLLFLISNEESKDSLIQEKNKELNIQPYNFNNYYIETLNKNNIEQAFILGALIPCCLSLNESGNKYLLSAIFDPNASITVIRDSNKNIISTAYTIYNEKTNVISFVHFDVVRDINFDGRILKNLFNGYIESIYSNNSNIIVSLLPGEETFTNFGYDVSEFEKSLFILINKYNSEYLPLIKNIKNNGEKGYRTFSKSPCLTFILENFDKFNYNVKTYVLDYIKNLTKNKTYYSDTETFLFPKKYDDRFDVAKNNSEHSISQIAIDCNTVLKRRNNNSQDLIIGDLKNNKKNFLFEKLGKVIKEIEKIELEKVIKIRNNNYSKEI